jgi:hypothetical protein
MRKTSTLSSSFIALVALLLIGYIFVLYSVVFPAPGASKCPIQPENGNIDIEREVREKDDAIAKLQSLVSDLRAEAALIKTSTQADTHQNRNLNNTGFRPGMIVLGMHRSGTSIVGGLINKMGLKTGGPLIGPAEDNAKGFFERIDVVLQNDYLMRKQNIDYSHHMYKYDALVALKDVLNDDGSLFKEGKKALTFLNNPANYPWMLKDPRLCVTFRMWLPLLNFVPAILFTYRHPMDVALSFLHRYEHFPIGKSLRMWYVYNRRAIEQSNDLCRVVTSHRKVMSQPKVEMDRIYDELRECGVPVPHTLKLAEVEEFVDPKLQHGKSALKDSSCDQQNFKTLALPSVWQSQDPNHLPLYREVMRVFCALEDGSAFHPTSFVWDKTIMDM